MVVQHNLTAMNSNRMLGITTKSQAKATEKLSSGYKINRAADDAAGLSISEKMRKQIRGLTQASSNAQDGISAVQTAEGALTEVHDMLQRMNELAVKAANGTNSEDDRAYIQAEVDQLVTEIDRVSTTTKFNETYLLKGDHGDGTGTLTYTTANGAIGVTFDEKTGEYEIAGTTTGKTAASTVGITFKADADHSTEVDPIKYNETVFNLGTEVDKEFHLIELTQVGSSEDSSHDVQPYNVTAGTLAEKLDTDDTNAKHVYFSSKEDLIRAIKDEFNALGTGDIKSVKSDGEKVTLTAFADLNKGLDISLHVGADSTKDNKIGLTIEMMSARGLGINGIKVDGATDANATASIDVIKAAIQKVSEQRSALGAVQNRLEHTIANLDNIVENTQSAESAIRDTDMATQMVAYSNNNILAQAGQAMLAQANQSNQGVMSLLQ